jgi:parvulin-like peptidyl-prolyl isomerase
VAAEVEQALIELYLTDMVASQVKLTRSELNEFYEVNKEKFRGPEMVRLDFLILDEEAQSREAAQRLHDGADFAFIFREYRPGQEVTFGESDFISVEQLSQVYRDQLPDMEVGDSSEPVKMSMGWVIFKLSGRKPGEIPPIETVEIEIRRAVYQEKFMSHLDEHLALLKEHSDIIEHPDRIEAYILSGEVEG